MALLLQGLILYVYVAVMGKKLFKKIERSARILSVIL